MRTRFKSQNTELFLYEMRRRREETFSQPKVQTMFVYEAEINFRTTAVDEASGWDHWQ